MAQFIQFKIYFIDDYGLNSNIKVSIAFSILKKSKYFNLNSK